MVFTHLTQKIKDAPRKDYKTFDEIKRTAYLNYLDILNLELSRHIRFFLDIEYP